MSTEATVTWDRPRATNPTIGDDVRGRPVTGAELVNGTIRRITPGTGPDGVTYHVRDNHGTIHEMRSVNVTKARAVKLAPKVAETIAPKGRAKAAPKVQNLDDSPRCSGRCSFKGEKEDAVNGVAVRVCDKCAWRASYPEKGEKVKYYPPNVQG